MAFLVVFACTVFLSVVLKPFIKKVPCVCYALAFALVVLYVAGVQGLLPAALRQGVFFLLQKGTLAVALFAVVMFIGVLLLDSKARRYIAPIRAELSIIACILACGHMVAYAMSYVPRVLSSGVIAPLVAVGLAAAERFGGRCCCDPGCRGLHAGVRRLCGAASFPQQGCLREGAPSQGGLCAA